VGAGGEKRLLIATWDGAGNLPPILALIEAFARRGHEVHVIGHDVQKSQIEAAGGAFIAFETAPQWDQGAGVARSLGADPATMVRVFAETSRDDILAAANRLHPAAVLIDCMLPAALNATGRAGYETVALVHALYSFFASPASMGGACGRAIDRADLALGLSYAGFDKDARFRPNLVFVGPARPEIAGAEWPRRAPERPLVVVSMSTGLQGAEGVQKKRLQCVCDALAGLEVEALVTTGRGIPPDSLTAGSNITLERRVAHDLVLPQADLLITHAGHGTVMAGLTFGVPMLCLAPLADQPMNAARVAELGLGEALDPAASRADIAQAISRLLGDPAVKERSRAFAAAVALEPGIEMAV
jgi:UDP:flavonoid glycosyltransferase YjiC (YdhE family)